MKVLNKSSIIILPMFSHYMVGIGFIQMSNASEQFLEGLSLRMILNEERIRSSASCVMNKVKGVVLQAHIITIFRSQKSRN